MARNARLDVRVTANFERDVDALEAFLREHGSPGAFQAVMRALDERLIPTLERFPRAGRDFLARNPESDRAVALLDRVRKLLPAHATVREYILDRHLILYAENGEVVHLLAIRHHRQLSYRFDLIWR